ncbi:hypothetical protein AB1N83_004315 [Pleurotus pulmonarius]
MEALGLRRASMVDSFLFSNNGIARNVKYQWRHQDQAPAMDVGGPSLSWSVMETLRSRAATPSGVREDEDLYLGQSLQLDTWQYFQTTDR